jgi:aminopeptidase N
VTRRLVYAVVALVACLALAADGVGSSVAAAAFTHGAPGLGDRYFPRAGNGGYDVRNYRLELRYDPETDRLDAVATLDAVAVQALARFNLDFGPLDIAELTVNGRPARWNRADDTELEVTPAVGVARSGALRITMRYSGKPGDPGLDHGFRRTADGAFVAGEPLSATDWFPSNDHPRDKATYDFAITVPDGLTAIANGVPAGSRTADGWVTWRWREGAPMATYLATVVIGRFRVTSGTAAGVPVVNAVAESLPPERADAAIEQSGPVVEYLATIFGPYPFDAIGGVVVDSPQLNFALETQTRPVYSPAFFNRGSTLDKTSVVVHELAHQWFGDSVSVYEWRDVWLNEGFATYAQWLWSEHEGRRRTQDIFDGGYQGAAADFWAKPPGDPGPKDLFNRVVYDRGAMTVHALRMTVGDDAFFRIVREWAASRRYGNGTTAQFVALAEQISGVDLDALFAAWLYGTVKPPVPVRR